MKIKICGLWRREDIEYANALKPDYIGFVFAPSRRQTAPKQATELKAVLSGDIQAAGVFVDEEPKKIIELLERSVIDVAQLHGNEEEAVIEQIRTHTGKSVWKAIKVTCAADLEKWRHSQADCLVLDNGQGTGEIFDWQLLKDIGRPYFLAGGIQTANIKEAVHNIHPYGIDVSSGVETNGVKDFEKMKEIIRCVRER